ncbi:hypothetical protein DSO57_1028042 [Entomophthora muscae]|uniref:Uncharacterized protein n=1 Tax=Entomophthora muscae TaxID=34485 RepID=A0ACC2UB73_9FUNG|nr:hypothetical protein DSO57_1028042 [Entomophthora muscae]
MRILGCVQQEFKWPTCALAKEILHPQPFLKISRASLAQPSLMLFEGERAAFTLTLTNEGPVDANLVEVEFQGKLGKCVPELLTWKNHSPQLSIPSKGECTLTFEATGRSTSGQGIVIINYAHLLDGERSNAYCRKKFYHVNLSISPTIHAIDFDVINGSMAFIPSHMVQALKEAGMSPNDIQRQFCLLAMSLKNPTTSSIQLICNLELDKSAKGCRHSLTETVAPLESKRIFIPFRRLIVDREALEKGAQEQSIKQQLVKELNITWQMQDGRVGEFLLDWVNITDTIRPIIQLEEVWLHTSLETNEGSGATLVNPFHYRCNLGKLVRLLVVLKNNRAMPITPCIRIQPYLDYHNGHFDVMLTSLESSLTPAVPLLVLGRNQEIFDEVSPHSSTQYVFEMFPSGIGQFRIGCSCQDLSDLLTTKSQASHQTIDSTPLFLDVAPLVVDIVDPPSA